MLWRLGMNGTIPHPHVTLYVPFFVVLQCNVGCSRASDFPALILWICFQPYFANFTRIHLHSWKLPFRTLTAFRTQLCLSKWEKINASCVAVESASWNQIFNYPYIPCEIKWENVKRKKQEKEKRRRWVGVKLVFF